MHKYFSIFRAWCCMWCLENSSNCQIGGVGTVVEIDESKFGKRKYNKGRKVLHRNQWVLGGYCRNDGKIFLGINPLNIFKLMLGGGRQNKFTKTKLQSLFFQ